MGFYSTPAQMFSARADSFKREGDRHWAQAKNGNGDFHYAKAKRCYEQAAENRQKADNAARTGASFGRK